MSASRGEDYDLPAPLLTVAFEVTSDRPTADPIGSHALLAEKVERVLRDMFPDHMIRRLDPETVLNDEVWR